MLATIASGMHTRPELTLEEVRGLGQELERYLRSEAPLEVPVDRAAELRAWRVGEPFEGPDGVSLPPWRIATQPTEGVELTWTIDLGHESGTRVWLVANVDRVPGGGWKVRGVSLAHAHRARGASG